MYLTPEELHGLTDRTYAKHQIAWLSANDWQFAVSALGRPKVLRSYAEGRGGLKDKARRGPRLDGLAQRRIA